MYINEGSYIYITRNIYGNYIHRLVTFSKAYTEIIILLSLALASFRTFQNLQVRKPTCDALNISH